MDALQCPKYASALMLSLFQSNLNIGGLFFRSLIEILQHWQGNQKDKAFSVY